MQTVYLDYAATTPVDPVVFRAMQPYFADKFGNPGSLHSLGQEAIAAVDRARETLAKAIGAGFQEIIFTGSATEANNLAIRGIARRIMIYESGFKNGKILNPKSKFINPPRIVTSAIEHESVLETCRDLEQEGIEVVYLKPKKNGILDPRDVERALSERTVLVSIMYANNEIGTVQPIPEIAKAISEFRISKLEYRPHSTFHIPHSVFPLLHNDAVQAFQFLDCEVNHLGVDLMTLSAHKIYGPKGVGALYARQRLENRNKRLGKFQSLTSTLSPLISGGGQEFGLRSGTENVPAIVGFAKAVELVASSKQQAARIGKIRDYFVRGVKKIFPKAELNGDSKKRLPNILNIYFPGHKAADLLMKLDLVGIAASSGSACRARSPEPSHVLTACGMSRERVESSVRFSFGQPTTKKEVDEALRRMRKLFI